MKVKIIGAGSIGNHLAQAARRMGWDVSVVDTDARALDRMRTEIYPTRYGSWDDAISLHTTDTEPKGNFDIIMVGTPPDVHIPIARAMLKEQPRLLHIEKPLCTPDPTELHTFVDEVYRNPHTMITVGYDHAVSEGIEYIVGLLKNRAIGRVCAIDVEFREHWKGIFSAHPWLAGPADSYLGYWKRGGGAGGEHSHALHLWRYLAKVSGWSLVAVQSAVDIRWQGAAEYDEIAAFLFTSVGGGIGRVVQDVVTDPPRKCAFIQGDAGRIEWHCNGVPEGDVVRVWTPDKKIPFEKIFPKKRQDDFFREMRHYDSLLKGEVSYYESPLALERGVDVMEILQKAYRV